MNGPTIGSNQVPNTLIDRYSVGQTGPVGQPSQIGTGRQITGSGSIGQTGSTPEVGKPTYSTMIASIARMIPTIVNEVVEILLAEVAAKMKDLEAASDNKKVEVDTAKKREALDKKINDLKEATKKIEEAIKAANDPFGWLKSLFDFFAGLITQAIGAALFWTGVGTVVMAAGFEMMANAIDKVAQNLFGKGFMHDLLKTVGIDEKDWNYVHMAAGFVGAGVQIAASIAAAVFVPGAQAQAVMAIISAVQAIVEAVINIVSSVQNLKATELRAEAKKLEAGGKELEALMKVLDEVIDMALQRLIAASKRLNEMLDAVTESMQDRADSLIRTRFST